MAEFPGTIPTINAGLVDGVDAGDDTPGSLNVGPHAAHHNKLAQEVVAIATTLGPGLNTIAGDPRLVQSAGASMTGDLAFDNAHGVVIGDARLSRSAAKTLNVDGLVKATGGLATITKAGVIADADITGLGVAAAVDGTLGVNTLRGQLQVRSGGSWLTFGRRVYFHPKDYGVVANDSTDDTTAWQNLINAAQTTPGGVIFVPEFFTSKITDILNITATVAVTGAGFSSIIRQATWGKPIFEVRGANDVRIESLYLKSTATRSTITGPGYDGNGDRVHCAGIYEANSHRLQVRHVRVTGMVTGVTLRGSTDNASRSNDNIVDDLVVDTVDWGVLAVNQERMILTNIRGSVLQSQDLPHLIYTSKGNSSLKLTNGTITNCICYGTVDQHAYGFKNLDGFLISNIAADDCAGFMVLDDVTDSVFTAMKGTQLKGTNEQVYILAAEGPCDRNVLTNGYLESASGADGDAIKLSGGSTNGNDNRFSSWHIRNYRTSANTVAVRVRGNRNTLTDFRVELTNSGVTSTEAISVDAGTGHTISGLETKNAQFGVEVLGGVTGTTIEYNPARIGFNIGPVYDGGTGTIITRADSVRVVNYAGSFDTDASRASHWFISTTGGSAWTINNPTQATPGMRLTYDIKNTSGGAGGAISWGAAFLLSSTVAAPGNGERVTISFYYNGTNWVQMGRAGLDTVTRNLTLTGSLTLGDASNVILGTATGTKIGTATSQKLGFFNATPIVQPSGTPAAATDLATVITLANALRTSILNLGLAA